MLLSSWFPRSVVIKDSFLEVFLKEQKAREAVEKLKAPPAGSRAVETYVQLRKKST